MHTPTPTPILNLSLTGSFELFLGPLSDLFFAFFLFWGIFFAEFDSIFHLISSKKS
jgi:hypothetical protein